MKNCIWYINVCRWNIDVSLALQFVSRLPLLLFLLLLILVLLPLLPLLPFILFFFPFFFLSQECWKLLSILQFSPFLAYHTHSKFTYLCPSSSPSLCLCPSLIMAGFFSSFFSPPPPSSSVPSSPACSPLETRRPFGAHGFLIWFRCLFFIKRRASQGGRGKGRAGPGQGAEA